MIFSVMIGASSASNSCEQIFFSGYAIAFYLIVLLVVIGWLVFSLACREEGMPKVLQIRPEEGNRSQTSAKEEKGQAREEAV